MGRRKNRKTACPADPLWKRVALHHLNRIGIPSRHLVEAQVNIELGKMVVTVKNESSLSTSFIGTGFLGSWTKQEVTTKTTHKAGEADIES